MTDQNRTVLTNRFQEALVYAAQLHTGQKRKGSGVPYVAHLMGTASIALEYGADEDQTIAALLHDAVEDQGGLETLSEIRLRFGPRAAMIVEGCTDSFSIPKPPWRQRKEAYLQHLKSVPEVVLLVSASDKLYNAMTIVRDLRNNVMDLWNCFKGGREGSLWYYRALVDAFRQRLASPLVGELDRVVTEMERLAGLDE